MSGGEPARVHDSVFAIHHPLVPLSYIVAVLVFTMAAMEPVISLISLIAALLMGIYLRDVRATFRTLAWMLPLIVLITLLNGLFTSQGSTELGSIFGHVIYLEPFVFGLSMALMLAAMMLWFSNLNHLVSTDSILGLLGNRFPTISLMITMTMRLVPTLVKRGKTIADVQEANRRRRPEESGTAHTAAGANSGSGPNSASGTDITSRTGAAVAASSTKAKRQGVLRDRARQVSVLMGWSMEESLETADSMKARFWGLWRKQGHARTSYRRFRFRMRDICSLIFLAVLVACAAVGVFAVMSSWTFYPTLPPLVFQGGYVMFALVLAFPLVLRVVERGAWGR